jgi:hypothetical protein
VDEDSEDVSDVVVEAFDSDDHSDNSTGLESLYAVPLFGSLGDKKHLK